MKLLDFNLEEALKEPERVVFADGTKVDDWYYFKGASEFYPVLVYGKGSIEGYSIGGRYSMNEVDKELDLKLLPKTKTWHFCVYSSSSLYASALYESREVMLKVLKDEIILQEYTYTEEIP